jgi:hypothetical protein
MMKVLNETTVKFLSTSNTVIKNNVTAALAFMANICQNMVAQKQFTADETNMFCLRAMTGAIILYDHLHPQGAFCKKSPVNIKGCIQVLKSFNERITTDGLLNALRFTTVHLSDPETPNSIKQLLN